MRCYPISNQYNTVTSTTIEPQLLLGPVHVEGGVNSRAIMGCSMALEAARVHGISIITTSSRSLTAATSKQGVRQGLINMPWKFNLNGRRCFTSTFLITSTAFRRRLMLLVFTGIICIYESYLGSLLYGAWWECKRLLVLVVVVRWR